MNCRDLILELSNYLDGELDAALKREVERHLEACGDCRLLVHQTRRTIEIFCNEEPVELPPDVRSRLYAALRKKLQEAVN